MTFHGQIPEFEGSFEPNSIYVVFLDVQPKWPTRMGILLIWGEHDHTVAELFQYGVTAKSVGRTADKYNIARTPKRIESITELHTDHYLNLQIAVKLKNGPLDRKELRRVRDVLTSPVPDVLTWRSYEDSLAAFLARIGFIFQNDVRFRRTDKVAERVIKLGNDAKRKKSVLSIWTPTKQSKLRTMLRKFIQHLSEKRGKCLTELRILSRIEV
ncbi:hypothetical protein DFH11DRAFT_1727255 [Phellopilus nigrolimitatus]|nr:hypothetical protein DFH11DRAFT_1727255 [Phellopilus nigrolimitatus]